MSGLKSAASSDTAAARAAARLAEERENGEAPDIFLQALEGAVHALCGNARARLRFARGAQSWGAVQMDNENEEASLRLPGPPPPRPAYVGAPARKDTGESRARWLDDSRRAELRGLGDQAAFQLRYHDPSLHRRLAPRGGTARQVFERMERARCDAVGMRRFAGAAGNIGAASLGQLEAALERQRRFGPEARAAASLE
ncbi:MAG: hypothetical protein MPK62_08500, partial [Alphaproteobacteria bacterium]|nr:hypothetical protein [Alphaproteobacteria bacterium]